MHLCRWFATDPLDAAVKWERLEQAWLGVWALGLLVAWGWVQVGCFSQRPTSWIALSQTRGDAGRCAFTDESWPEC
jgi:hypothetical protein